MSGFLFCDALSQPLLIPDNLPEGISNSISITDQRSIMDLNVRVRINHPFVSDLRVTLTHEETGTVIQLIDRPGLPADEPVGCFRGGISCTLDDEASFPVEDQCAETPLAIRGRFIPNGALAAFQGESLAGTWRLNVADLETGDAGSLFAWCLEVDVHAPQIIDFTCNGHDSCALDLDEPFSVSFSFIDDDDNASSWRITVVPEDGSGFEGDQAGIQPPSGAGLVRRQMSAFTCPQGGCPQTIYDLVLTLKDTTGLESEPFGLSVLVHASP